jgi:hypothetical protein
MERPAFLPAISPGVVMVRLPFALAALLALPQAARATDYPPRHPGLWEITMTMSGGQTPPHASRMCIDAATDARMQEIGMNATGKVCSRHDIHRDGNVLTIDSVCKFGNTEMTNHDVITFTGDTAYHGEIKSHANPPLYGPADKTMTQDAKWVGPCPADMQPGDITTPMGKMNILTMQPPPGPAAPR